MYIYVKVAAGAKREFFAKKSEDHFEIWVRDKAERNRANARVVEMVAEYFKVSKNQVRIVNGHRSPGKLLVVG